MNLKMNIALRWNSRVLDSKELPNDLVTIGPCLITSFVYRQDEWRRTICLGKDCLWRHMIAVLSTSIGESQSAEITELKFLDLAKIRLSQQLKHVWSWGLRTLCTICPQHARPFQLQVERLVVWQD